MPIEYRQGDLFESGADWLVAPVNCVGVMGAGLAKQFKLRFPWVDREYRDICHDGILLPGLPVLLHRAGESVNVVLFPTKNHWRHPSKLSWIDTGLRRLSLSIKDQPKSSIAIPPLGCGLGGLDWNEVRLLVEKYLGGLDAQILVYEPGRRDPS